MLCKEKSNHDRHISFIEAFSFILNKKIANFQNTRDRRYKRSCLRIQSIAHAVLLYGWRGLAVYFVLGVWRYLKTDKLSSSHAFFIL